MLNQPQKVLSGRNASHQLTRQNPDATKSTANTNKSTQSMTSKFRHKGMNSVQRMSRIQCVAQHQPPATWHANREINTPTPPKVTATNSAELTHLVLTHVPGDGYCSGFCCSGLCSGQPAVCPFYSTLLNLNLFQGMQ